MSSENSQKIPQGRDDTVKLLRECDAGVKMGIDSIEDVLGYVKDGEFKTRLEDCRAEHEQLGSQVNDMLRELNDEGKSPNPVAKSMSWMKTNVKLAVNESDETIADLMTDGCNMGVKSLNRYLNQYKYAEPDAKRLAEKLSRSEEQLAADIRMYL